MQLPQPTDATAPRDPRAVAVDALRRGRRGRCGAPDDVVRLALVALLSGGHLLVEGVPGTGKTLLAKSLAAAIGGRFGRVQCTPDLLPGRRHRHLGVRPGHRRVGVPSRADLRQRRARRRGEPRVAAHAGRAARADGGAPGHRRRRDAPAARSVLPRRDRRTRSAARARSRCPRASSTGSRWSARSGCPGRDAEREILDGEGGIDALDAHRAGHDARRARGDDRRGARTCTARTSVLDYVLDVADATRNHPGVALGASPRASLSAAARRAGARDGDGPRLRVARRREAVAPAVARAPHRARATASTSQRRRVASARSSPTVTSPSVSPRPDPAGPASRCVGRGAPGPGELTLTSIVLFTLGAYGVAAGAASGEQSRRRGRRVRVHAVRRRHRVADRRAVARRASTASRRPTRPSANGTTLRRQAHGRARRGRGARARPAGRVVA